MGSAIGVILILASVDVSISLVSFFCFAAVVTVVVVDVVVVVGALQYKGEISVNINFRYVSMFIYNIYEQGCTKALINLIKDIN